MVATGARRAATPAPTAPRNPFPAGLALHLASLVAGLLALLYLNRDQWFAGDEWAFLGHRGVLGADRNLFEPHNEHWSTAPILVYRALFALFGVRSYLPYVAVLVVLHLVVAHLLWRILRRSGVDAGVATAVVCVFVLLGAGYENLLWAFQIGFVGSVACGVAALLLVDHDGPLDRRDAAACGVLVLGLTSSGIGVTMAGVAGLAVLLRRGLGPAAATVAVPALVYAAWLAVVGKEGLSSHPRTLDSLFRYPDYVWRGLSVAFERTFGIPGVGPVVIVLLTGWLLRRGRTAAPAAAPAFAGALGAGALFLMLAVGRTALGVEQADSPRYAYITMALLLPALGLVVHELCDGLGAGRLVVWALLGLVVLHNVGVFRTAVRAQADEEQRLRAHLLAAAHLVAGGAPLVPAGPPAPEAPDVTVDDLRSMGRRGKMPVDRPGSPADRLWAQSALQVGLSDAGVGLPGPPAPVRRVTGATPAPGPAGCVTYTPVQPGAEVQVGAGRPLSLRVRPADAGGGGELAVILGVEGPEPLTGPPRTFRLEGDRPRHLDVTAEVDYVALRLPAGGPTELCGLGA